MLFVLGLIKVAGMISAVGVGLGTVAVVVVNGQEAVSAGIKEIKLRQDEREESLQRARWNRRKQEMQARKQNKEGKRAA